jgi:hypothetical protein
MRSITRFGNPPPTTRSRPAGDQIAIRRPFDPGYVVGRGWSGSTVVRLECFVEAASLSLSRLTARHNTSNSGSSSLTGATNSRNSFRSNAPKCSTHPTRRNHGFGSRASSGSVIWRRASSSACCMACFNAVLAASKSTSLDWPLRHAPQKTGLLVREQKNAGNRLRFP